MGRANGLLYCMQVLLPKYRNAAQNIPEYSGTQAGRDFAKNQNTP